MKSVVIGAVLAGVLLSSSYAADLPVKARPAPAVAPACLWCGLYVGVNAGGVWGRNDTSNSILTSGTVANAIAIAAAAGSERNSGVGFIGGGQIGYNWQLAPSIITGVEADIQGLSLDQKHTSALVAVGGSTGQDFDEVRHTWLATFRARLGFTWDRSLLYVTGGAAVGDTRFSRTQTWSFTDGCPLDPRNGLQACHVGSVTKTGWGPTVGAGWEYAFAGPWSAKVEYLHVWLPSVSFGTQSAGFGAAQQFNQSAGRSNLDIVRVGVNYRFSL